MVIANMGSWAFPPLPQAGRRVGWHWPLHPAPAFREVVNVLFARTEEIQKVHAHVFAGLADAQENQVFLYAFWRGYAFDCPTQSRKRFDGMLGIVVVPRYAIKTQKREQLVSVLLKPFFQFQCGFSVVSRS